MVIGPEQKTALNALIEKHQIGGEAVDYIKNILSKTDTLSDQNKKELNALIEKHQIGGEAVDYISGQFNKTPPSIMESFFPATSKAISDLSKPEPPKLVPTSVSNPQPPSVLPGDPNTFDPNAPGSVLPGSFLSDVGSLTTRVAGSAASQLGLKSATGGQDVGFLKGVSDEKTSYLRTINDHLENMMGEGWTGLTEPQKNSALADVWGVGNLIDKVKRTSSAVELGVGIVGRTVTSVLEDPTFILGLAKSFVRDPIIFQKVAEAAKANALRTGLTEATFNKASSQGANAVAAVAAKAPKLSEDISKDVASINSDINKFQSELKSSTAYNMPLDRDNIPLEDRPDLQGKVVNVNQENHKYVPSSNGSKAGVSVQMGDEGLREKVPPPPPASFTAEDIKNKGQFEQDLQDAQSKLIALKKEQVKNDIISAVSKTRDGKLHPLLDGSDPINGLDLQGFAWDDELKKVQKDAVYEKLIQGSVTPPVFNQKELDQATKDVADKQKVLDGLGDFEKTPPSPTLPEDKPFDRAKADADFRNRFPEASDANVKENVDYLEKNKDKIDQNAPYASMEKPLIQRDASGKVTGDIANLIPRKIEMVPGPNTLMGSWGAKLNKLPSQEDIYTKLSNKIKFQSETTGKPLEEVTLDPKSLSEDQYTSLPPDLRDKTLSQEDLNGLLGYYGQKHDKLREAVNTTEDILGNRIRGNITSDLDSHITAPQAYDLSKKLNEMADKLDNGYLRDLSNSYMSSLAQTLENMGKPDLRDKIFGIVNNDNFIKTLENRIGPFDLDNLEGFTSKIEDLLTNNKPIEGTPFYKSVRDLDDFLKQSDKNSAFKTLFEKGHPDKIPESRTPYTTQVNDVSEAARLTGSMETLFKENLPPDKQSKFNLLSLLSKVKENPITSTAGPALGLTKKIITGFPVGYSKDAQIFGKMTDQVSKTPLDAWILATELSKKAETNKKIGQLSDILYLTRTPASFSRVYNELMKEKNKPNKPSEGK